MHNINNICVQIVTPFKKELRKTLKLILKKSKNKILIEDMQRKSSPLIR
jgi:hypothetical protein